MILTPAFLALADEKRIERALSLSVRRYREPGQYHVTGGSDPAGHYVDIRRGNLPGCDCEDFTIGGNETRPCKHILAAKLLEIGRLPGYAGVCSECGDAVPDGEAHETVDRVLFCDACAPVCTAGVR